MNGEQEPWLNSESDIQTFNEVYRLIVKLLDQSEKIVPGDFTGYPFITDEDNLQIRFKDHSSMEDVRLIQDTTSKNATGLWNDLRGPFD